ncbi:intermembrane lipid transfer protein VPS13A-like [Watersipora subatra]|uniref:intermembrane lipid transfer protein VPS13A-like n=1 Tax=Watersipora subatra TaxID=2589382 RepID=UPI00355B2829
MKDKIATSSRRVKENQFVIRPINCTINMVLDTHPERSGFKNPQLKMGLVLQEIGLQVSKTQYYDVMEMLESFERMVLADKYRKYRQYLPPKPTVKQMWMYAYKCVLEEDVKRRKRMWSWLHMKRHRELMKIYKEAYKKKLESAKKQSEVQKVIEQCEKELDVFSIVLMRSQAEMEVARAQKVKSKSSLFSFFKSKASKSEEKGIKDKINDVMTKEEYDKLYKAIGYEESGDTAQALPPDYTAYQMRFELHSLSLTLLDVIEKKTCKLISMEVSNVMADLLQKPSSGNMNVKAKMGSFGIQGLAHDSIKPMIVKSLTQEGTDLLDLEFELKPPDKSCDQRICLTARATEIVYDAMTINHVVTFFKPPEHVKLKQLSQAAASRYKQLKQQSAEGFKDIVQHHKYTEVIVDVEASYVLIPETGTYRPGETNMLLIDLGNLKVLSEKDPEAPKKYRAKAAMKKARRALQPDENADQHDQFVESVMEKAYDSFTFHLDNFQMLYATKGSDWAKLRKKKSSPLHIIQPMGYKILLQKCMIEDPRLANIKISGKLPQVQLSISDERILDIIRLALSITLPDAALPISSEEAYDSGYNSLDSFEDSKGVILEERDELLEEGERSSKGKVIENATNMTELDLNFEIEEIELKVLKTVLGKEAPFLKLKLDSIGAQVMVRSFDVEVESYLGGIYLQHLVFKVPEPMLEWIGNQSPRKHKRALQGGPVVNLINTPVDEAEGDRLLTFSFLMAYNDNPEFMTTYKNTENSMEVVFSHLEVLLHEEALLTVVAFAQDIAAKVEALTPVSPQPAGESKKERRRSSNVSDVMEMLGKQASKTAKRMLEPKAIQAEITRLNLSARMDVFECSICTDKVLVTHMNVQGFDTTVLLKDSHTEIRAKLTDIEVLDPEPSTKYPKVVSIAGSEVFSLTVTLYNKATVGLRKYSMMENVDTRIKLDVSSIRFIFLYRYIRQLIAFVDNFDIAKKQALEFGAKAGEMALDAAQSMHQKATRVGLAITVKAPIITIPSNSTSVAALIINLGTVTVYNVFQLSPDKAKNKDGYPAVLDCMVVSLKALQVQRASINPSNPSEPAAVCLLLNPVDMKVDIRRNLASSWYHTMPIADIKGEMPTVKVTCSQGDFTVLMTIMHENLSEGVDPYAQKTVPVSSSSEERAPIDTSSAVVPMISLDPAEELFSEVKVSFKMDILEAVLYNGETNLEETVKDQTGLNTACRSPSQSLARFSVSGLSGGFEKLSNGSMNAQVCIYDCNLDDIRPCSSDGITKMIERVGTQDKGGDPMIKLEFIQREDLSKKVDVHLHKLFIIIALPYLMAVSDFFIKGMPKFNNTQKSAVKESKDIISEDVSGETLSAAETIITLHVKHPEIILVEDAAAKSTNALILDTGIKFQMRMSSRAQTLDAGLELQIFSALYSIEEKEYQKMAQIMAPCNIDIYGSAPDNQGMHINLTLGNLDLCVSPAIITTISKIASNLQLSQEDLEASTIVIDKDIWTVRKVADMCMWYLNPTASDDFLVSERDESKGLRGEQIIVAAPSIIFKLEGGVGNKTVPLLVAEIDLQADTRNWSSKLYVEANLSVAVSYFNEKCSVWEPFLEPVDQGPKAVPWNLTVEVKQNDQYYTDADEDDSDCEIIGQQPPKMSLSVFSEDSLQIVLSKAGLDMLTSLSKSFEDAYKLVQPSSKLGHMQAPYKIVNSTGTLVAVTLDKHLVEIPDGEVDVQNRVATLQPNQSVQLQRKKMSRHVSILKQAQEGQELQLSINMLEHEATREVVIQKAIKRCFHLFKQQVPQALIVETTADLGRRLITLRSDTEVLNTLDEVVTVFYMDNSDNLVTLKVLNPGDKFSLPLQVVYGNHQALYFKPHVHGVEMSAQSVKWKTLAKEKESSKLVSSVVANEDFMYNIMVQAKMEAVYSESSDDMKSSCFTVTLRSPIVFFNQLPYAVEIKLDRQAKVLKLEQGKMIPMHTCAATRQTGRVVLKDYLGSDWTYTGIIDDTDQMFISWTFVRDGHSSQISRLAVCCKTDGLAKAITLYSPYWFMNRTGLDLFYKNAAGARDEVIIPHEATYNRPFLFCFKKLESAKEKACLKINDSQWSDKFSLDTIGSSGTAHCKSDSVTYKIGVQITLGSNSLTKIVECSPYYILANYSNSPVSFVELNGTTLQVASNECLPFWPHPSKTKLMKAGVTESTGQLTLSESFLFDGIHSTLLKLGKPEAPALQKSAINVEVTKSDLAVVITVDDYKEGMEAARIVNCMASTMVTFHQKKNAKIECLDPGESCLYTWNNPLDQRALVWSSGMEVDKEDELVKDDLGEFFVDKDSNHKAFWVSFLDGMQRVLLFTEDILQATRAQEAGVFERIDLETIISLEGAGLSLVDNKSQQEIAYMGLTSSGIVWEEKKNRHWKAFNNRVCDSLEEAFIKYNMLVTTGKEASPLSTIDRLQVDFSTMRQLAPAKRAIRRTFQPGIWVQFKTSLHQTQLHAKINRLQLDNQLSDAVYAVVFSPTPLPKSVAAESVPKPFIEASLVIRKHEHSDVQQIKYLKVLVQEMTVKADQGFINAIIPFFGASQRTPQQISKDFEKDLEYLDISLLELSAGTANKGHKNFYDELHISPLKIHLSFSVQGTSDGKVVIQSEALQLFMQSVGVALTDVQDIIFRIAYFERKYMFFEKKALAGQIQRHYTQQIIKQAYVLVLGLDVLGNPFGLIEGLADGAKGLFYEPIQGAIQGPEEFVEGVALGLRSLLSGTLGGAAGAVSRITGTLGKGLAAITLDKQYQQSRREKMTKEPKNIQEGLARGVKGLGMGFYDGVTGIVKKPVQGAKQEGVEGFFKGLGKGLIGVVARPTGGIVDFASSSFEGIRRATTLSQEVTRLRPPRIIRKDGVITPYNYRDAAGSAMLKEVAQGRFYATDQFLCHCMVTTDGNHYLLATDKRVLFLKKGELLLNWDIEWSYDWVNLQEPPSVVEGNKLRFFAKSEEKKKFSLFGGKASQGKLVPLPNYKEAEWMAKKMAEAYKKAWQGV